MLSQKHFHQPPLSFRIRLIPHGQIRPFLLIHDTLTVGKGLKPGLPMITAHTALPEAAEAHVRRSQVDDCVIDAAAAKGASSPKYYSLALWFFILQQLAKTYQRPIFHGTP